MPEVQETAAQRQLEGAWRDPTGLLGWFRFTTHQAIGKRYIVTAFIFLIAGGIEALLMRLQLAKAENTFLNPDLYNQIFSTHGTTMMFLFAVPVMEGMGIYLVPMMVGTRNVAFPRLNAFGYWLYVIGGIFLYAGFLMNNGPDAGWFSYTPLSGPQFSPGKRVDFWAQMITFTEFSALAVATELVVTIFKMRAPGMTLNRVPVFVWGMLVQSFMVIFAMPAIMVSSTMLIMDRLIGTHFFNPAEGGDPLFWQHLFWFFGHPEVYIIFIPATAMVSAMISAHTKRPIFGYLAVVLSLVATGFIGFGLWVHHMFATGLPQLGETYFTAASMMIAIPTGVQIFCWIATLWGGGFRFTTPMLFVLGFIATFVIGGLTGVQIAAVPFNLQVHDTFFIVAHLHYVLIGGAVFPLLGAIYHWFPKMTGRMMSERLGKINFWLVFIGFHLTFFPMHILGLRGMPRRIYTYGAEAGWQSLNQLATIGAMIIAAGGAVFLWNVAVSRRRGAVAGPDPWGGDSLEWTIPSPPPNYNFATLPSLRDEYGVVGLRRDRRETISTSVLDATPDRPYVLPGSTIWPLIAALAVTVGFIGSVFNPWWILWGSILSLIALLGWFWPHPDRPDLPEIAPGHHALVWWGGWGIALIEGTMFGLLTASYFYLRLNVDVWPPPGIPAPDLKLASLGLILMLASCYPAYKASQVSSRRGTPGKVAVWMALNVVLALSALACRAIEWHALNFKWNSNAYGSIVWMILWLHTFDYVTGIVSTVVLIAFALAGAFRNRQRTGVDFDSVTWYFIVAVWIPLYLTVYIAPQFLKAGR